VFLDPPGHSKTPFARKDLERLRRESHCGGPFAGFQSGYPLQELLGVPGELVAVTGRLDQAVLDELLERQRMDLPDVSPADALQAGQVSRGQVA
jgi:hypothetical protein